MKNEKDFENKKINLKDDDLEIYQKLANEEDIYTIYYYLGIKEGESIWGKNETAFLNKLKNQN